MVKEVYLGDAELRKRNQITVPRDLIDFYHIVYGDKLLFIKKGDNIIVGVRGGVNGEKKE